MDTQAMILAAHVREIAKELRTKAMRKDLKDFPTGQDRAGAELEWAKGNPLHIFVPDAIEELNVIAELLT